MSDLASPQARANWTAKIAAGEQVAKALATPPGGAPLTPQARRAIIDSEYLRPGVERLRQAFAVQIESGLLGGVRVDTVTPAAGISPENRERVLINLHGGGMTVGAGYGGQSESIPIAALGRIKVITVDYRMAPEHRFPAASEDVAAVYRALLRTHRPANIGIYGCSSGADLTAQATAWFERHGLPRPGAIGLFGSGAGISDRWGDSFVIDQLFRGQPVSATESRTFRNDYLAGANPRDPLIAPAYFPDVLSRFPPTLLITGTRDVGMSATIYTHAELVAAGAVAELHVFEGAPHCSFAQGVVDPDVPETRRAWAAIVRFFDRHLSDARVRKMPRPGS